MSFVNFKVTLKPMGDADPIVQRFQLEEEKKFDFIFLREKLINLFPRLKERIYQVKIMTKLEIR